MRYYLYGPMELPRGDDNLLNFDDYDRTTMWAEFEANANAAGLSNGCGCYVFAIRSGAVAKPWYVGKAERQTFKAESLAPEKVFRYNEVLSSSRRGTPVLYFYARGTAQNWSRPTRSRHPDIDVLERLLIGAALSRNKKLVNTMHATMLKNLVVPGFLNSPPGALSASAKELKAVLDY